MSCPPGRCSGGSYKNLRCIIPHLLLVLTFAESSVCEEAGLRPTKPRNIIHMKENFRQHSLKERRDTEAQENFEVSEPIQILPGSTKACSILLLQHTFANTVNLPPVVADYHPARNCNGDWDKVVLVWHGTSRGRQFDRIAAVWLGGVEIFRTCTVEPTEIGVVWEVEKDITRYTSLFKESQSLVVSLANVVDKTYTGVYNITITVNFYHGGKQDSIPENYGGHADVILPISLPSPLQGGYWFQLQNESDAQSITLQLPTNAYKAILEISVSAHEKDEFWYTNPPDAYLKANNLTGVPGNGTFREVLVSIDGVLAGAVFPFPILYTGGIDPFLWRPAAAIGSLNLPSYDVDVTPFIGKLVDGEKHNFSMTVTNAQSYWLLGANLHLWVDKYMEFTKGELFEYVQMTKSSLVSNYSDLDGSFITKASRTIAYKGYVESSFGNLTTSASYKLKFSNSLVISAASTSNVIHQEIKTDSKVVVNTPLEDMAYEHSVCTFPLQLLVTQIPQLNGSDYITSSLEHAWLQDVQSQATLGPGRSSFNSLKNKQKSKGDLFITPNNTISGEGQSKQEYFYDSTAGCYTRSLSTKNYTILYDHSDTRCSIIS